MPAVWTTPRNYVAGELITASIANQQWRDNSMYLKQSPVFDGNVTVTGTLTLTAGTLNANVVGNVTGNVTGGTISGTTGTFSGAVTMGSVTGGGISGTIGIFSGDLLFTSNNALRRNTADTADNGYLQIAGGGGSANTRGAVINCFGNEYPTIGGSLQFLAGDIASGQITFYTSTAALRGTIHPSGGFSWGDTTDPGAANLSAAGDFICAGLGGGIRTATVDGADNALISISSYGTSAASTHRGASLRMMGNEWGGAGTAGNGIIQIFAGDAPTGGVIYFNTGNADRGAMYRSGGLGWGDITNDPGAAAFQVANRIRISTSGVAAYSAGITGSFNTLMDHTGYSMVNWPSTASAANANIVTPGLLRIVTSVRAAKRDIETIDADEALRVVRALDGVTYRSALPDDDDRVWSGLVAEDVDAVAPTLATYDKDGRVQSVAYDRVVAYLIPAFKALEARLARAEARLQ